MDLWEVLEFTDDIGLNDYPLYDPTHREELNQKIINRYLNREIGHETIDQFVHNMRRKMHEIMPYYNQLYATEQIKYDPLKTIDMRTVAAGSTESSAEGDTSADSGSKTTADGIAVASDFPQTSLDSGEGDDHIGRYGTSSSESKNSGEQKNTANESRKDSAKGKSDSDSTTTGYQGVPAQLVMQYRSAILNVDLMVVEAVNELFMSVLAVPDQYSSDRMYY
jgi:hypothetical protein